MYPTRAGGWVRPPDFFVKGVGGQQFDTPRPITPSNPICSMPAQFLTQDVVPQDVVCQSPDILDGCFVALCFILLHIV